MRYQTYDVNELTDQRFSRAVNKPGATYRDSRRQPPDDQPNNHFFTAQYAPWAMAARGWKAFISQLVETFGT